ncbi:hypothetical protein GC177_01990 [bacterium]|nr:hypothetical protein [bacterium]
MVDIPLLMSALNALNEYAYEGQSALDSLAEDSLMVAENLAAEEDDTPELRHWQGYIETHLQGQTAMFATIRAAQAGEAVDAAQLRDACLRMGRFIEDDIHNTRQNIAFSNDEIGHIERFGTPMAFIASIMAELEPYEDLDVIGRAAEAMFHPDTVLTDAQRTAKTEKHIEDDIKTIEKDTDHLAWLVSLRQEWQRTIAPLLVK